MNAIGCSTALLGASFLGNCIPSLACRGLIEPTLHLMHLFPDVTTVAFFIMILALSYRFWYGLFLVHFHFIMSIF